LKTLLTIAVLWILCAGCGSLAEAVCGGTSELSPLYYRGVAYLQLNRAAEAPEQFQKVLEHWATRPDAAYIPLSHLGLARADLLLDDKIAARTEYEECFALWEDADPDISILRRFKAEQAKIQ
jgi:eukaryotic-like serine/threonine-protein kinase